MKLLLDENLSRRIVPFIQDLYPDSSQVVLVGLENTDDKTIRQYAIEHDFVIVTKDADYYEMTVLELTHNKMIPFVVSLSNHELPFDKLRANDFVINLYSVSYIWTTA